MARLFTHRSLFVVMLVGGFCTCQALPTLRETPSPWWTSQPLKWESTERLPPYWESIGS